MHKPNTQHALLKFELDCEHLLPSVALAVTESVVVVFVVMTIFDDGNSFREAVANGIFMPARALVKLIDTEFNDGDIEMEMAVDVATNVVSLSLSSSLSPAFAFDESESAFAFEQGLF